MKQGLDLRLLVLALVSALEWNAAAQNVVFVPSSGNWNVPGNWTGGSVPNANQNPIVLNGSVATVDASVGTCGSVFVGQSTGANRKGTVLFRNGATLTAANLLLGRDENNYGQFNQTGGTLAVPGYVSVGDGAGGGTGASGEYNLSAGTLQLTGAGGVQVGNQGVGRMLVAGSAGLSTPSLAVGNTVGSSGSQFFQWGGTVYAGNVTVGSAGASNCAFTISAGATVWGGTLLVNGLLTAQGSQFQLQGTNTGGVGLQVADTGTLQLQFDALGLTPIEITGSQLSIAPGSKLVVDGAPYSRWNGSVGSFPLLRHGGYAGQANFTATNVTFTGFGNLTASLGYSSNAITLVLTGPTNGVTQRGQGLLCEYWNLPINQTTWNNGHFIDAPLTALPSFTNSLVIPAPVLGTTVSNVNLTARMRDTNYFMRFSGYLNVPTNGSYTFFLNSDDGSLLWLDDVLLVNNDGAHAVTEVGGTTNLTAGIHKLVVGYFQNSGSAVLELRWSGPGLAKQLIPDAAVFLAAQPNSWVRQPTYQAGTYNEGLLYNYAPSFMYDETEGLYKIWFCGHQPGVTILGDNVIYKEATSLAGLLAAPLQIALAPSGDATKFDQVHACDPNVYRVGDLYYLTYSGNTDGSQLMVATRIGMAVSYDRGRTFQRLHGGVHIIAPGNNFIDNPNSYGIGQSAVVPANDGYYYMIYTDSPGDGTQYERVVRSLDPAFPPGSFTNVANLPPAQIPGSSLDLTYDTNTSQFIVINGLTMIYFDANWNLVRTVIRPNPFAWAFGEGHGLLMDSRKHPINYNQDGVPSYVFAAATAVDPTNTTLWAWWVAGDLKYLVMPQTTTPPLAKPQVISAGQSFAGDSGSVRAGTALTNVNNFTVDFWARPNADAALPAEATSGSPGTGGQRYVTHPEQGGVGSNLGAGHAGMGVSLGRNGIGVFEHADDYLPSLLTWNSEMTDWVHVAVVYTNKTPWLYLNGLFVHGGLTSTQTFVHPSANNFGGSVYGYYSGQVWNYRVWNRSLTAAEVALLPGAAAETNLATALVGKWLQDPPLDQGNPAGTKALAAVLAGAVAGQGYTWQLPDNGGGRFTVNATNGLVTVLSNALLNFATNTVQALTVGVVDSNLTTFARSFTLLVTASNDPPVIATMSNRVTIAGASLTLATPATDPDLPPQALNFALLTRPTGATINSASGLISWRPTIAQGGTTNLFTVRVRDSAFTATQTFSVVVIPSAQPTVTSLSTSNGQFALSVTGDVGPNYTLLASTNLVQWTPLLTNTPTTLPVWLTDPTGMTNDQKFYRVRLGP